MFLVDLMRKLIPSRYFNFCCESFLLKEDRNIAPYLQITHQILINFNNLFSLNKVSDVTIIIDASIKESGASLL